MVNSVSFYYLIFIDFSNFTSFIKYFYSTLDNSSTKKMTPIFRREVCFLEIQYSMFIDILDKSHLFKYNKTSVYIACAIIIHYFILC